VHDPTLLEERIAAQGLDPGSFGFYLNSFRYGMPPHAGWGLGAERLLMVLTDTPNVRETILFPRDKHRLVP
jgi:aspartyl-tRNA synthetase